MDKIYLDAGLAAPYIYSTTRAPRTTTMLKIIPTIPAGQSAYEQAPLQEPPHYMAVIPCNLCGAPMERAPRRVCSACITASLNPGAV